MRTERLKTEREWMSASAKMYCKSVCVCMCVCEREEPVCAKAVRATKVGREP